MSPRRTIRIAILVPILALGVLRVLAGTTGAIEGTVLDAATGRPMEGVRVTIVSTATETLKFDLVSDKKGRFYKAGLYSGAYQLTVEMAGYAPQAATIRVKIDDTKRLEVRLQPAGTAPGQGTASAGPLRKAIELISAGRYEEAAAEADTAVTLAPADPIPYFYRALAKERTGQADAALEDYRKAIALKPDFVLPLDRVGMILARKGDFEGAAESYRLAIERNDTDAATFYNYGVSLVNAGRRDMAKAAFEKLLAVDPLYADGLYQLALIELGSGNSAAAADLLRKFVDMDPRSPNATIATEILKSLK
jgi:tetratricopeptide (TPR) repeat protein